MTPRDVTVIVPTYDRRDVLVRSLASIPTCGQVVVVVKEGRMKLDAPDGVHVMTTSPKGAYVGAIQDAISCVATKLVLVSNDDAAMEFDTIWNAVDAYSALFGEGEGVIALNHGKEYPHLACFPLMSREWFMRECYPMPYHHYCADNEWTAKAQALGCYGRCSIARINHKMGEHVEPWHTDDWKLYHGRMMKWAWMKSNGAA